MPELPEVETVARQLAPLLKDRRVLGFEIFDAKLKLEHPEWAVDRTIGEVLRRGKRIVLALRGGAGGRPILWLCVHLRMTGRLYWTMEPTQPPEKSLRARLTLDRGFVEFKDVRRFGTMLLTGALDGLDGGGIDPLSEAFTPKAFGASLAGSTQEIKPWLLRQDRLAGLGNIYAAEALFLAKIAPRRRAGSLTHHETRRLRQTILDVLRMGIEYGGTTISDYHDAHGEKGSFQDQLAVYGRAGQPCRHCREPIARIVQQGRGTFFCPRCQN